MKGIGKWRVFCDRIGETGDHQEKSQHCPPPPGDTRTQTRFQLGGEVNEILPHTLTVRHEFIILLRAITDKFDNYLIYLFMYAIYVMLGWPSGLRRQT